MDVLIAVLLAGGILTIGAQLARRRQASRAPQPEEPAQSELEALRPGDIVVHGRADLVVQRVVRLAEGATCWSECALEDDGRELWLVLHPADPQHALLGGLAAGLPIVGQPPEQLEHEGRIFRLRGSGQARAESDAPGERGTWDHWEYDRPGAQRLWIRRLGQQLRVCAGERVARHLLEVLPAGEPAPDA